MNDSDLGYEHPVLGKISDAEIELISWDRQVKAEIAPKIKKLNKILTRLKAIYLKGESIGAIRFVIEDLEKFRDEEL